MFSKSEKQDIKRFNEPEKIWQLIPEGEFGLDESGQARELTDLEKLKCLLRGSRFATPEEIAQSPLRLKEVISQDAWNARCLALKGAFYFITMKEVDNLKSLRLWRISFPEYQKMENINLNILEPSYVGQDAIDIIGDDLYEPV